MSVFGKGHKGPQHPNDFPLCILGKLHSKSWGGKGTGEIVSGLLCVFRLQGYGVPLILCLAFHVLLYSDLEGEGTGGRGGLLVRGLYEDSVPT